jgi:tRNA threonylcarbamoyl adenosine modification protein YeaZ
MVEVAIDTASDIAGVALTRDGALVSELTWQARQSHSRELLPTLDRLLQRSALSRSDMSALFVCIGPGSYAGLRVGLSTAKGLAYALDLPLIGIGRLSADAHPLTVDSRRVIAVHAAGRAELAWAAYTRGELTPASPPSRPETHQPPSASTRAQPSHPEPVEGRTEHHLQELTPPRLSPRAAFLGELRPGDLVVGDLEPALIADIRARGASWAAPHPSRVVAIARLGYIRLQANDIDSTDALVPLYLREPAIGPQPSPP